MIKVSVIIPVYNMQKYIEQCLNSILEQTLKDIEIICIDDGSTDNTLQILEEYEKNYTNVTVYKQHRSGAGPARNLGIRKAKGKYIAFMDSDDYYPANDVLCFLYDNAEEKEVPIAGGRLVREVNGQICGDRNPILNYQEEPRIVEINEYPCYEGFYRFVYKREMLIANQVFFPELVRFQDPPFMLQAFITAGRLWISSKVVYVFREFDKKIEMSSRKVVGDIAKGQKMLMHMAGKVNSVVLQRKIATRIMAGYELYMSHICCGNGDLLNLIREIAEEISDSSIRQEYTSFWDEQNLEEHRRELLTVSNQLATQMRKYGKVIIYGAGVYAKGIFDFAESLDNVEILGFGVSKLTEPSSARGMAVRNLSDYLEYRNDALVVVATEKSKYDAMHAFASKLGFENIMGINNFRGYFGQKLTEGQFAFDNRN